MVLAIRAKIAGLRLFLTIVLKAGFNMWEQGNMTLTLAH